MKSFRIPKKDRSMTLMERKGYSVSNICNKHGLASAGGSTGGSNFKGFNNMGGRGGSQFHQDFTF